MPTSLKKIALANLRLDLANPRLPNGVPAQADAQRMLWASDSDKMLELAEDIVENGLSPAESLMVMNEPVGSKQYTVLEGNRRLSALKSLRDPDELSTAISTAQLKRLKKLSARFDAAPITNVETVVFDSRDDANDWIEKRHSTGQGGAGLVAWESVERARFRERLTGQKPPELAVLDYVVSRGTLPPDVKAKLNGFPLTNLQRLIDDKAVRRRLGLQLENGTISGVRPEAEVLRALTRVVTEVAGKLKVGAIYDESLRQGWLDTIKEDLPLSTRATATVFPLASTGVSPAGPPPPAPPAAARAPQPRTALIPRGCRMVIGTVRIKAIEAELKSLNLIATPNAVAVLFRVFTEMTVDHYIAAHSIVVTPQDGLAKRMKMVGDHLLGAGRINAGMNRAIAASANSASNNPLYNSIVTLQQWVHNAHLQPAPGDLRAHWDNLQPMFVAVWQ